jgi:signal peptidase
LGAFAFRSACVLAVLLLLVIGVGPRTGRYRVLTVLSGSMRPELAVGSMVVVTPEPASSVRPGQVITFERPLPDHEVVTHRVMKVEHEHGNPVVITRGDANNGDDPWRAELVGRTAWRARAVVPGAGHVLELIRSKRASRVAMMIVPILLAAAWLAQIWLPARPDKEHASDDGSDDAATAAPPATGVRATGAAATMEMGTSTPRWVAVGALGAIGIAAWSLNRSITHGGSRGRFFS